MTDAALAGWRGTPVPEWFGSWWGVAISAAAIALAAGWLFRSLRRWRQPPPGEDEDAEHAENVLRWITHRNLPG